MITYLNENTIALGPDPSAQRRRPAPRKALNGLERQIASEMKSVVAEVLESKVIREQIFLLKQLRRANDFQAALVKMGCRKDASTGLPGYFCPPSATKVMIEKRYSERR